MSAINYVNISLEILSCIICFILLLCVITTEDKKDKLHRIFLSVVCCHIPLMLVDTVIFILEGKGGFITNITFRAAYFFSFILGAVLLILFTRYLITFIGIKTAVDRRIVYISRIAIAVCGVNIVLIILTQFYGLYYFIDGSNIFYPGDWYWLSQILAFLCIAINTGVIMYYRKNFGTLEFIFLLSYAVLPTAALITQNFVIGAVATIDVATMLTILIFYIGIQSERSKQLKEKELELTNLRIDVMLSQIQPHFLYNTLTTIETFCYKDGNMAAKLVRDFSTYLRENMDSLTQKEPVSFERELEHIKIYLDIEKLRFEERLSIIYDFEVTDFNLPILTIQPLVENAVHYGVTQKLSGVTVTIATRRVPEGIKIIISDDGVGFSLTQTKQQDGRSHVGIENVRERLRAQCGGTLSMDSAKEKGTVCTIIIPRDTEM